MLRTNAPEFECDLAESVTAFLPLDEIEVEATENRGKNGCSAAVKVNGRVYEYPEREIRGSELEIKRMRKRNLKLAVYKSLSAYLGRTLPWGSLTGIRPTKLAVQLEKEGADFRECFEDELMVSHEKTELVGKILEVQKPYRRIVGEVRDLFVGIPFCPSRCAYCSFMSAEVSREKLVGEYVEALIKEIAAARPLAARPRSVYIGGGTPVSLPRELLERVLAAIRPFSAGAAEYTVEAGRPDCLGANVFELLKKYGVTRVCVNPQSFSDATLSRISRKHTAADAIEKFRLAKSFGFDVNMDLIAGLEGESFGDFKASVDKAIELNPENITVHTLSLKRGSVLKERIERLSDEGVSEMVDYAHSALSDAGYNPYYLYRQKYMAGNLENTGYSKPNKECVYNIDVMEELASVVACGANAVSKRVISEENRVERYGAPKDIPTYAAKIDQIIEKKNRLFS